MIFFDLLELFLQFLYFARVTILIKLNKMFFCTRTFSKNLARIYNFSQLAFFRKAFNSLWTSYTIRFTIRTDCIIIWANLFYILFAEVFLTDITLHWLNRNALATDANEVLYQWIFLLTGAIITWKCPWHSHFFGNDTYIFLIDWIVKTEIGLRI